MLKLVALLPLLAGCGTIVSPDPTPALADADFDGWRDGQETVPPLNPGGPIDGGPLINAVVDRVIEHVDSIDAKVHFKQNGASQAAIEPGRGPSATTAAPRAKPPSQRLLEVDKKSAEEMARFGGQTGGVSSPSPPPAPPAEPFVSGQGEAGTIETLDIPKGWTGAAVYHAATCPHCPPLLAGLKSRATQASGDYLRINGCWFLLIDWDKRPDVDRPRIGGLPAVLYFVEGRERIKDRVIGFGNRPGELDAIIDKHPLNPKRTEARDRAMHVDAYCLDDGSFARSVCPCGPGCACLAGSECGCIGGNVVAPFALKSSPLWYGASLNVLPARHSAGISLFGMPVLSGSIGTYPTCPTGSPPGCH